MTFKEIQELVKLINKSNITEFKVEKENFKLSLRTKKYGKTRSSSAPQQLVPIPTSPLSTVPPTYAPSTTPPPAAGAASPAMPASAGGKEADKKAEEAKGNYTEIRSPMVGTFYRSSSPEKPPYVKVGDHVAVGDVVCIIEAMKLFNEIESEVSGKIVKVMVEDAQPVEYDQVLYLIDPS